MMTLLRKTRCEACGGSHDFCLDGPAQVGREYAYYCPSAGREATLRPEVPGVAVRYYPTGAVALASWSDRLRAAPRRAARAA